MPHAAAQIRQYESSSRGHGPTLRVHVRHDLGMTTLFDNVDVERLRRRRTVKWTLYGPDVLAAWVAEMDFDVAPVVRTAMLDAVDREDFGYIEADLGALTDARARPFLPSRYGWVVPPARIFPVADVLGGISTALDVVRRAREPASWSRRRPIRRSSKSSSSTGRPAVAAPMIRDADRDALDLDAIDAAARGRCAGRAPVQPAQSDRARLHRRPSSRRWPRSSIGTARGSSPTRCTRRSVYGGNLPCALRDGVRRRGRAHHHGHVGIEGVQPRGLEVRAGRRVATTPMPRVGASCACSRSRDRPRSASPRRLLRTATAATGSVIS